jgi:hypothetical protein
LAGKIVQIIVLGNFLYQQCVDYMPLGNNRVYWSDGQTIHLPTKGSHSALMAACVYGLPPHLAQLEQMRNCQIGMQTKKKSANNDKLQYYRD